MAHFKLIFNDLTGGRQTADGKRQALPRHFLKSITKYP
jgi:hypothetical protein